MSRSLVGSEMCIRDSSLSPSLSLSLPPSLSLPLSLSFSTSLSLAGNSGRLTRARHSSRKSSATRSSQWVQHFHLSRQWYGCQSLGFLTCAQMLLRAIAHGGCTDTVRESALGDNSGRKIPCRNADSNPRQYCAWPFLSDALLTELSPTSSALFRVIRHTRHTGQTFVHL